MPTVDQPKPLQTIKTVTAVGTGVAGAIAVIAAGAVGIVSKWEGLRQDPYTDIAGVRSYCYGETHNVEERHYTADECKQILLKSIIKHAEPVLNCLPDNLPYKTNVAFVSIGYNIGASNFCSSSMSSYAKTGQLGKACEAIMPWNKIKVSIKRPWPCKEDHRIITKSGSHYCIVDGLTNRRIDERDLCLKGLKEGIQ